MTEKLIARRLPFTSGVSGWEAISSRRSPMRQLDVNLTTDWLIIGGGFAGLSAARRLSQLRPGERIVILEAGEIALGTSGRNSGFMIDLPHDISSSEYSVGDDNASKAEIASNRQAIAFAADAASEYKMSSLTFNASGKINAAATKRGMQINERSAKSLAAIGEPHQFLDKKAMSDITGSNYYQGGLFSPGTAMIQPADYIRDFAEGISRDVEIFERSPALGLERVGGTWKVTTPQGVITTPRAIFGVNGLIEDFGFFRGRLMHIFTYASMTAGFSHGDTGQEHWGLLPADPMGATVRKITKDGLSRIVVRTRFTYDRGVKVSEQRLKRISDQHRLSFDARFPSLRDLPFDYRWAGRLCLSLNHVPAFGEVDIGLYSACCENGLGTVKSTLAGVMAAELATGTKSRELEMYMNQPMPKRLPPEPVAWLGINGYIRLMELRAGREK